MGNIFQHEDKTNTGLFVYHIKGIHRTQRKFKGIELHLAFFYVCLFWLSWKLSFLAGFLGMIFLGLGEEFHCEGDTKNVTDIWEEKRTNRNFVVKSFSENYLQLRLHH